MKRRGGLGWVGCFLMGAACTGTNVAPVAPEVFAVGVQEPSDPARGIPDGPNLILVVVDAWRPDQLPPWGGDAGTSPTLAGWTGLTFDTTVAASPWTRGAYGTLATGLTPEQLFPVIETKGPPPPVPSGVVTLAERLREAGWATLAVSGHADFRTAAGFGRGFELFLEADSDPASPLAGEQVVARAVGEAKAKAASGRPVFAVLGLPYTAGAEPTDEELARFRGPGVPPRLVRYRANLPKTDAAVAAAVREFTALDPSDTWILVIGARGDGLGYPEGHGTGHGNLLYSTSTLVPFLVAGPSAGPGRIGGLSHQVDVVPTVLGLAGLANDPALPGENLAPLLRGGGQPQRELAFTSTRLRGLDRVAAFGPEIYCQLDLDPKGTARLVTTGRGEPFSSGCCGWRKDPACESPMWDAEVLQRLRAWRAASDRPAAEGPGDPGQGPAPGGGAP